jgi:hypothetical protein
MDGSTTSSMGHRVDRLAVSLRAILTPASFTRYWSMFQRHKPTDVLISDETMIRLRVCLFAPFTAPIHSCVVVLCCVVNHRTHSIFCVVQMVIVNYWHDWMPMLLPSLMLLLLHWLHLHVMLHLYISLYDL